MKTMHRISSLLFILILTMPASMKAQAYAYYSGIVKNTDNQPIQNVTVSSIFTEPVLTDSSGEFFLIYDVDFIIPEDSLEAYFTHPAYNTIHRIFRVEAAGDTVRDTVIMHALPDLYTVSGRVSYENGDPVRIGEVAFFSIDGLPEHSYYATPDPEGNYQIMVPEGSYYIRSRASYRQHPVWAYRYIYYNGAANLADADIYTVSGDVTDLNIVHPPLSIGSISGKVIDAATQQPLELAEISVSSMPLLDSNITSTDANGEYTVNVFEGDYTLFSYKTGYKLTFYDQVYNLFEAAPVSVTADNLNVTGIDFALITPETGTNTISGNVTDEDTGLPLNDVEVFAIPLNGGYWELSSTNGAGDNLKKLMKTDNNGVYTLKNIVNGAYVLLFYKKNYIGTYNGGAYAWENAPVITLSGNSNINVNTSLKKMNSFGGEISGNVTSSGTAVSGSLISALDQEGNIIAAEVSGSDGNYVVPSLAEGEFTVKASKVGKYTTEYPEKIHINYVSSLTKDGVNLLLTPDDVKDKPVNPEEYDLLQNYSNPFNPSTTITYDLPVSGYTELKVFDILGNEVASLVNGVVEAGRHEITFNAKDLSSGIYFYRLKSGNFLKTMKMILMK